ncbi:uncharacterized protein LOC117484300 [Xyrichtys novacula]|uniref:Gypsy retrotransposon integrase-like protein 1 n=1 Tax=Xyrichtys novacula TaxID=13765 RepID=A0AAV1FJF5_XYRNO|nr:uncharacterized protein LOC117484300 [Xyrichtys novacula]
MPPTPLSLGSADGLSLGLPDLPDDVKSAHMASICTDAQELGAISWFLLAQETAPYACFSHLLYLIEHGERVDANDSALAGLSSVCASIYAQDGVLLYCDRVVVPPSLRDRVLWNLHAAHQGISAMEQCARAIVYWPGMSEGIRATRYGCADCNCNAPSQAATPPTPSSTPSSPPSTPFEAVFADYFDYGGCHYLVVGDRLLGWVEVLCSSAGTDMGGSAGLIRHLRSFFGSFGVPVELSSDGGPEFVAAQTQDFLRLWDIRHRVSSVAFPQSNGRVEVAVKTAKRLLMSNTGPSGSLDHDRFLRAMIQLRNTPDPDCDLSPAQIIYGRPLRGSLSFVNRLEKFSDSRVRPLWRQAWAAKEDALRTRMSHTTESLRAHSRSLRPLALGARVFLQNQQGPSPTKWDRSSVVVESLSHDQYRVKPPPALRRNLRCRCDRLFPRDAPLRFRLPTQARLRPRGSFRSRRSGPTDVGLGPSCPSPCDCAALVRGSPVDPRTTCPPDLVPASPPLVSRLSPPLVPRSWPPSVPRPSPPPSPPGRPCHARRPPMHNEPESGRWELG